MITEALREAMRPQQVGEVYRVPSRSTVGAYYEVRLALDGELICNCAASINNLGCWHVKYVREEMMTNGTAIAIRPVALQPPRAVLASKEELGLINQAAMLAFSGAVALPKELNTQQKVAAVMLYGWELGLKPMTAIRHLYIVNGRVAPSCEVMAGLMMASEPDSRLSVEELTDQSCTMRLERPSRNIDETYTVTWPEIVKAGLDRGDMNSKYPRDRLRYHCTKRLLRIYAPDAINNLDGPSLAVSALGADDSPSNADMYNEGDDQEIDYRTVDGETGEIYEPIRDDQRKQVTALWQGNLKNKDLLTEARARWSRAFTPNGNYLRELSSVEADEVIALFRPACDHDAVVDPDTTLMVCAKCGVALETPPTEGEPAQAPLV